jgi:hypothetical protein
MQEANCVVFKSPSLQLDAEAEASDTASSVASNVRRRVIVRQNLQHRRQARSELRRNVAVSSHRSTVKFKPNSRPARSSGHPRVDRPDRSPDFAVESWRLEARHTPTARPKPVAWLRVGGRRSTRARKVRSRSIDRVADDPRAARPVQALADRGGAGGVFVAAFGAVEICGASRDWREPRTRRP